MRYSWRERAACRGHGDLFLVFPERNMSGPERRRIAEGLAICSQCPVLEQCRSWAMETPDPPIGTVIGGMSPAEYRTHRRPGGGHRARKAGHHVA